MFELFDLMEGVLDIGEIEVIVQSSSEEVVIIARERMLDICDVPLGVHLDLMEQLANLLLEAHNLVVDAVQLVQQIYHLLLLALREVVVAPHHLQPIHQICEFDCLVSAMLLLRLLFPMLLKANILYAYLSLQERGLLLHLLFVD